MRKSYGKIEGVRTQRKFAYQQLVAIHFLFASGNPIGWEMFEDFIEIDELSPGCPIRLYQAKTRKSQWTPSAFIRRKQKGPLLNFYNTYKEAKMRFGGENFEMILITNNGLNSQLSNLFEDLKLLRGISTLSDILEQCSNKTKECIEMIRNEIEEYTGENLDNEIMGHFLSKISINSFILEDNLVKDAVRVLEEANSEDPYKDIEIIQGKLQKMEQRKITLGDVEEWIGVDIAGILKKREEFDMKTYLQRIIDSTESISSLYVPLKGIIMENTTDCFSLKLPLAEEIERKGTKVDIIEIFRQKRRITLIGASGSGKTTVLKYFTNQLAKKALKNVKKYLIPLLIDLNKYRGGNFIQIINMGFLNQNFSVNSTFIKNFLDNGRFFIILDGLNEIKGEFREEAVREIQNLIQFYQETTIVISSREIPYAHDFPLEEVYIEQMNTTDVVEFMKTYFEEFKRPRYEAMNWYVQMSPETKEIARNPLMLTMIVKLIVSTESLPKNRSELFRIFVDWILEEWERKISSIDPFIKKYALSIAAYTLNSLQSTTIERDQIMIAWGNELSNLKGIPEQNILEVYNELLMSGIIRKSGSFIHFLHQSFQDYFAALYIERNELELEYVSEEWWRECILFLAGIADKPDNLIIKALNETGIFFACELLINSRLVNEETRDMLRNELRKIINNDRKSDYLRSTAMIMLGKIGIQEDMSFISAIANNKKEERGIRMKAFETMARCKGKLPIKEIGRIFLDIEENFYIRYLAARLISRKSYEDYTIELLRKIDYRDEIWKSVFTFLIFNESSRALKLVHDLISDKKAKKDLRINALCIMSEFARDVYREEYDERFSDHHEVVETILSILNDKKEDIHVRRSAVFAIPMSNTKYRENFYNLLMDKNNHPQLRKAIAGRFSDEMHFSNNVNDFLLGLLLDEKEDVGVKGIIAQRAAVDPSKHFSFFKELKEARIEIIQDPFEPMEVKIGAVIGLGYDGLKVEYYGLKKDIKMDQILLKLLRETEDVELKESLIECLVRRKVTDVIEILEKNIKNEDKDLEWRKSYCLYLRWMRTEKSIEKLFEISLNPEINILVRKKAVELLGSSLKIELKDSRIQENIKSFLIEFLKNNNANRELKKEAVRSLAEYIKDIDKIAEIEKQHLM